MATPDTDHLFAFMTKSRSKAQRKARFVHSLITKIKLKRFTKRLLSWRSECEKLKEVKVMSPGFSFAVRQVFQLPRETKEERRVTSIARKVSRNSRKKKK